MVEIGYMGPKGTFSQEAVMKYIKNREGYSIVEYSNIPELILAVNEGKLDEAIVPIENSLEGAVNSTMDLLIGETDLMIREEIVLPISENLMVADIHQGEIKYIISHPQPIGQCKGYIAKNYPKAELLCVDSTAEAAIIVANGRENSAVIGSTIAADIYGLHIIAADIQDGSNNATRFVILSKKDSERTENDKTSLVFSTEDRPGSLYRVLDIFNLWDINMTRIESRPAKNQLGSYIFFIDIEGHRDDENVRDALTMIKRKVSFFKFLGSYPMYK